MDRRAGGHCGWREYCSNAGCGVTLLPLTFPGIQYEYEVEGNAQPLANYLRRGSNNMVVLEYGDVLEYVAKVLLGDVKKGDKRRAHKESRHLAEAFRVRRLCADHGEREHGDSHVTNDDIYKALATEQGYGKPGADPDPEVVRLMIQRCHKKQNRRGNTIKK